MGDERDQHDMLLALAEIARWLNKGEIEELIREERAKRAGT